MSTTTLHPLAADYLRSVREAAHGLPRTERRELLAELEAHLQEATQETSTDAEVHGVLDRLGEPQEIVDAYEANLRSDADLPRPARPGWREYAAIPLLLVGGFIVGIGWVIGLVLLWSSPVWRTREKWLGTLVIPGGLLIPGGLAIILLTASPQMCRTLANGARTCTPASIGGLEAPMFVLIVTLAIAALATATYLIRQAR
jgi:hypothetical protein